MQLVYSAHTHSVGVGEVPGVGQPAAEVVICASPVRHTHRASASIITSDGNNGVTNGVIVFSNE